MHVKKNNIFFAATLVVAIFGGEVNSMAQATATAGAGANIIAPISMIKTVDMNFGNIAVSVATGGTVILSPSGTRSTGGSGALPCLSLPALLPPQDLQYRVIRATPMPSPFHRQ